MGYRHFWLFLLGAALGGGGMFLALTTQREVYFPHAVAGPETVRVLVAKQALAYGTAIEPGHLRFVEWPRAAVPPGAFTSAEALLGATGDRRRIVLRQIEPGEPILASKITKPGESLRMAMNLGAGMRAVSIQVDAASGVAGFIAPGDRVDILLTRREEGVIVSSVLVEDVTVIAIDQSSNAGVSSPRLGRTVTLAVDVAQAEELAAAQHVGTLSLVLRGTDAPEPPGPGRRLIRGGRVLTPLDLRGPEPEQITDFPIHPALEPPPDAN